MLELRGVTAYYGGIAALRDITASVAEGEIIALIGANGAGKTTTLMAISGIVPPRSGDIRFRGSSLVRMAPDVIVALGISQVPEGRRIFPLLTVAENLQIGAYRRRDPAGVRRDLEYVFALFPILARRRHQPGGTLSGGEQQMLAISRALMAKPQLLLLDEPSLGLAPIVMRQIFEMIRKLNREEGATILLVEQNAHLALKIAHRGYVMENGRITLEGPAAALLNSDAVRRAYLGM